MNKLIFDDTTYEEGQVLTCIKTRTTESPNSDFYDERLIIGESYKIEDIEFRFPNKVAVKLKGPYYFHSEYVPIELFHNTIVERRDKKIDEILD